MENKQEKTFQYSYSSKQQDEVESIKRKYMPKQEDKLEQLRKLDKSAETPGTVVGLMLGIIGTLVMGTGMSCVMVWTDSLFVVGILLGLLGMVMIASAYPVYKMITKKQREKIAPMILALSEELLK
ncbi:MAG: hypothetical protein IJC02_01020 [Lachnospiraceae bacterium]|nr:hypothetical protein [Lachnospiraceae bacterium]MBQ6992906.1 hypothetical protein [Lachnospiraceae bacterium]